MSVALRLLLIVSSVLTVVYILRRIHKSQIQIQDSVFWIVFSFVVLLMALFPGVIISLADMLGIVSPINFVFLVFIFFAYIKIFSMTIKIATLENKIKSLAYEIAIQRKNKAEKNRTDTNLQVQDGDS